MWFSRKVPLNSWFEKGWVKRSSPPVRKGYSEILHRARASPGILFFLPKDPKKTEPSSSDHPER